MKRVTERLGTRRTEVLQQNRLRVLDDRATVRIIIFVDVLPQAVLSGSL